MKEEMQYPTRQWVMEQLFQHWNPEPETERISVEEALGRVPAENQYARHAILVVRASAMDGVGVRSADFAEGIPDTSGWQMGREFVRADTGDDFDDQYDAVIRIEDVDLDENGTLTIHPEVQVRPGLGVRPRGSMLREGELLVQANRPLRPVDLAVLVMGGVRDLSVYRKPRVAFIPTGSELIPAGAPLTRGKNYDSNSILVQGMLTEMGAEPVLYPIVKDDWQSLEEALDRALGQADLVILNGGSSKGGEDFNARLIPRPGDLPWSGGGAGEAPLRCGSGGKTGDQRAGTFGSYVLWNGLVHPGAGIPAAASAHAPAADSRGDFDGGDSSAAYHGDSLPDADSVY